MEKFDVGDDGVHVSIQEFADYGYVLYRFNEMQHKPKITNEIIPSLQIQTKYETRYEHAFQIAYRDMFSEGSGHRKDAEKIAILITDGSYYPDMSYARYEAAMLRRAGIKLYVLAYGPVDEKFLLDLVNGNSSRFRKYDSVQDMSANLDRIYSDICPRKGGQIPIPAQPAFALDIPPPPINSQAIPAPATAGK